MCRLTLCKNLLVINDEAHHAYRQRAEAKISKKDALELGIDLTATPFAPTGKKSTEKVLFDWIVSDFGLNDAIEAGLLKPGRQTAMRSLRSCSRCATAQKPPPGLSGFSMTETV